MKNEQRLEELATVWMDSVRSLAGYEVEPVSQLEMIVMQIGAISLRNATRMDKTTFTELHILAAMVYKATQEYRDKESASEVAADELLAMLAGAVQ